MCEAKQYDDWNHTALLGVCILNSLRGKGRPRRLEELHAIEQQRQKANIKYVNFSEIVGAFTGNADDSSA